MSAAANIYTRAVKF